jgi:hypothetical protein
VTLAAANGEVKAHRLLLCASSDFFRALFQRHPQQLVNGWMDAAQ